MGKRNLMVKESNIVARAKIDPAVESVWDERIIALIAAQNTTEDKFFQEHIIPISALADGAVLSSDQLKEIRKAVKERVVRQTYVIPSGLKGFEAFTIFAYLKVDDVGNITAKLNPSLGKHFLELKKEFAVRSLPAFSTLSSTYSQQLFRYINSLKGLREVTVNLEELHNVLATPPSFRKNFNAFKERVLEVAHREITAPEKTGLYFEWQPIKKGLQKVVAIHFIFDVSLMQETPEDKARREHIEAQKNAEECWQMYEMLNKKCRPGKRSKKCQFCTTRGRMWARKFNEANQLSLPMPEVM